MTEVSKDTIYVDVDDEITNIIEKVKDSDKKIVALVLPKRATVLQSVVNMKLLKRSAESGHKKVVLITSESGLLPLAGAVGVYVAKNLQSKPEIPDAPDITTADDTIDEAEIESGEEPVDKDKTVGELAGVAAVGAAVSSKPKKAAAGAKKDSKLKIPNFEKFRTRLFLIIGGVVALFVFLYWAFFMAPSAKITVVTDTSTVNSSVTFTANSTASEVNVGDSVVPAKVAESKDVASEEVAATGQKDVGEKATGSVTLTAKNCSGISTPASIDSGWAVTTGEKTYVTQATTTFAFDSISGGCVYFTGSTNITAQKPGASYNTSSGAAFTVNDRADVTGSGSASGGTDKTVKVVSQSDVDDAAKKLSNANSDEVKSKLTKELEDAGYYAIQDSFVKGKPSTTSSPEVGSEASEATVTVTTTYTMTGVKKADLEKLITESANKEIDTNREQVINVGLDQATFTVEGKAGSQEITLDTIVTTGPKLDVNATIEAVAGKKRSEVESIISATPGVKEVRVDYSPFWVSSTPKNTSKIEIVFEDAPDEQQ